MPPKPQAKNFTVDEVLEAVLDDDGSELSDFEYGDLSEEEEDLINEGQDSDYTPEQECEDIEEQPPAALDEESISEEEVKETENLPKRKRKRASAGSKKKTQPVAMATDSWKMGKDADVAPPRRRFSPNREEGFQLPQTGQTWFPADLFLLFFPIKSLETIVLNTNAYGDMRKTKLKSFKWYPLTVKELLAFFSIIFFMGMVEVPVLRDYWNKDNFFGQDFIKNCGMSRHRFLNILAALHVSDLKEDIENERKKKAGQEYDPLIKVKPLIEELQLACRTYYVPGQNVSIDERMVASKGRFCMKQFIKDKPTRWGFKLWVLACPNTGYTYKFEIYTGKRLTKSTNGLGYDVVTNLMEGMFLQGYHLFVDNFYSSPQLFNDLLDKGCMATGTVRENRKGFPKNLSNGMTKKAERGTIRWFRKENLVFVKWRDTKDVCALSTCHAATGDLTVDRKKKVNGKFEKVNIAIPPVIKYYNESMGGVDLSDQLLQCYQVLRRTRKWWKTLFFHFLDIAATNAYIIDQKINPDLTHKKFRESLARNLLEKSEMPQNPSPSPGRPPRSSVRADHCPVPLSTDHHDNKATRATFGRKNCRLCTVFLKKEQKTPWKCSTCDIPLCLQLDRNCFQKWHTAECDQYRV